MLSMPAEPLLPGPTFRRLSLCALTRLLMLSVVDPAIPPFPCLVQLNKDTGESQGAVDLVR